MSFPADIEAYNAAHCVDGRTGFRPYDPPATTFKDHNFTIWLFTARSIPNLLWKHPGEFRKQVDALPILIFTADPTDLPQWRLAYSALSFIAHAYCWGASAGPELTADPDEFEGPRDVLPPQIAVPLKHIANHLGVQPGLTFSAMSPWNWKLKHALCPGKTEDKNNMEIIFSFTGTRDEEHFITTGIMVETAGGIALKHALEASKAAGEDDAAGVQAALEKLKPAIEKCREELTHMKDETSPGLSSCHG